MASLGASIHDASQVETRRSEDLRNLARNGWQTLSLALMLAGVTIAAAPFGFGPRLDAPPDV